jgi:shikimate kinase
MPDRCLILMGPRACGKSTTASALARRLNDWKAIDIDYDFHLKFKRAIDKDPASADGRFYYEGCREVLLDALNEDGNRIIALNGGALVNNVTPEVCWANIRDCQEKGSLVLLLPSRLHFINRRILFSREHKRNYVLSREHMDKLYKRRMAVLKPLAACIVYGSDVEKVGSVLIRKFAMEQDT